MTTENDNAFAAKPPADNDGWDELAGLDDDYSKTEAADRSSIPDGKYQVKIIRATMARSKNTDAPMLKFDLVVISGKHAKRHIFKNSMLSHNSIPFLKADLETLGIKLPKFSDLPKHLDAMLDQTLEVTVKTNGEYTNVYFDRKITVAAGADGPDETKAVAF